MALSLGADTHSAQSAASQARQMYSKGVFKKAVVLIEEKAKSAAKLTRMGKKK